MRPVGSVERGERGQYAGGGCELEYHAVSAGPAAGGCAVEVAGGVGNHAGLGPGSVGGACEIHQSG